MRPLPTRADRRVPYRIGPQAQLGPDGMQSCQLAVVGDADVRARLPSSLSRQRFGAEREVLPLGLSDKLTVARSSAIKPGTPISTLSMLASRQPGELGALAVSAANPASGRRRRWKRHTVAPSARPGVDAANWNPSRSTRTPRTHHGSPSRSIGRVGRPAPGRRIGSSSFTIRRALSSPTRSVIVEMPSPQPRAMSWRLLAPWSRT